MTNQHLPTGTVTFLFTDIEGSTRLLDRLGERFNKVIEDHNRLLAECFTDGTVVRTEGDAFFVVFESAPSAVAAAIAAQRALARHDWGDGVEVKVRMGLHTGEGTMAGGDYTGLDVYRAARIAAAANGGQVLLSAATTALAQASLGDVGLRDLGDHRLKDLPQPEHLSQLVIPGLPAEFPPPRSLDARPNNLTMRLTPFIGRERELREIKDLLGANRLVTLTGPGGTGKTRLSIQVALDLLHSCADGAYFVYLAPITDPALVATTIATSLEVMEEAGRPLVETLTDHLCDKEVLLVLDNFEQVVDGGQTIANLLEGAPRLKCLVTSREMLHLSGEQEYPVPPMRLPDPKRLPDLSGLEEYESVQLFLQRARAVRPDFGLTDDIARSVAEICYRLDGLPLAIELAAARVRLLTPQKILERLEPMLPLLTGGARDLPDRQRTLHNTIGWSFDLLDEAERAFFRRFSAFASGCTFEAAEAACDPGAELGPDAFELLESLVDKSLIRRLDEGEETRVRMLHVIREYAQERLSESGEEDEIRRRHADFFLALTREAGPNLFGADQAIWLDRLEIEHDNLRGALEWAVGAGQTETALRLGGALWRFWQMRGHFREAWDRLGRALGMPDAVEHPEPRAEALEGAGGIAYWMGDIPAAQELYGLALALRRGLPDRKAAARGAYNLACTYVFFVGHRKPEEAAALVEEAERSFRELDDRSGLADVLWAKGGNLLVMNETGDAIGNLEEALALYREAGNRFGEGWALHMLGITQTVAGRTDAARTRLLEAMDVFMAADDRSAIPLLLSDFSILATATEDGERALRLAGAAKTAAEESGVGITDWSRDVVSQLVDRMWTLLPRDEADRLFAEGQTMPVDEALAYARKED